MKVLCLAACLVGLCVPAAAQSVKGNEAVKPLPDGRRQVETPPLPKPGAAPCGVNAGCSPAAWYMVETPAGLLECTEPYARTGTCRDSSYGTNKLPRVWVVRAGGKWLQCQDPDLESSCADLSPSPSVGASGPAVQ